MLAPRVRLLLLVAALTGGDYLLWSWSSDGNSSTVALITGVALAPLLLAIVWIAVLSAAQALIARSQRHLRARAARQSAAGAPSQLHDGPAVAAAAATTTTTATTAAVATATARSPAAPTPAPPQSPPGRIAA